MYEYFDIHSHLYFPDFDADRKEEITRMEKANIGTISIGTNFETSQESVSLAEANKNIFAAIGQHPGDLGPDSVFDESLRTLVENKKVVAVGECGLDYFRMDPDDLELKMIQKTVFEYHIDFALDHDLPLMLHIRSGKDSVKAYMDALDILEHHYRISGEKLKGNAHFFAGNQEVLERLLAIGFTASFTGVITFTPDYDEFIKYLPLDMIMAETDAPFVAPIPERGKRSSPMLISHVVKQIAEIKGEDLETVKKALISNVLRTFPGIAS